MEFAVVENFGICACLRFQVIKDAEACCINQLQAHFIARDFAGQCFRQRQRFFRRVHIQRDQYSALCVHGW